MIQVKVGAELNDIMINVPRRSFYQLFTAVGTNTASFGLFGNTQQDAVYEKVSHTPAMVQTLTGSRNGTGV